MRTYYERKPARDLLAGIAQIGGLFAIFRILTLVLNYRHMRLFERDLERMVQSDGEVQTRDDKI